MRPSLHGGGVLQVGEVTCGGSPHLSCKHDQIKMRDCIDSRVTSPKRVTSPPSWGPPPPCRQALRIVMGIFPAMSKFFSLTFKWHVFFLPQSVSCEYVFLDVKTILSYVISIDFSSVIAKSGLVRHNLSKG